MQQFFNSELLHNMYMASVPLAILMLESDEEKEFMTQLYNEHRRLIVWTALPFYRGDLSAIHEITSDVVIKLCSRCKQLMEKQSSHIPGYIVRVTKNLCIDKMTSNFSDRENRDYYADEYIENVADKGQVDDTIFDDASSTFIVREFDLLSDKDKLLITLKHGEGLSYSEMAEQLGMAEGSVRTALSRAKNRLKALVMKRRQAEKDEAI